MPACWTKWPSIRSGQAVFKWRYLRWHVQSVIRVAQLDVLERKAQLQNLAAGLLGRSRRLDPNCDRVTGERHQCIWPLRRRSVFVKRYLSLPQNCERVITGTGVVLYGNCHHHFLLITSDAPVGHLKIAGERQRLNSDIAFPVGDEARQTSLQIDHARGIGDQKRLRVECHVCTDRRLHLKS